MRPIVVATVRGTEIGLGGRWQENANRRRKIISGRPRTPRVCSGKNRGRADDGR